MKIDGIRTNIPFHEKLIADPRFVRGDVHTKFLETFSMQG
jgi:acetyl-CoA carboxylase biotin carboxylase subunit